MNIKKIKSNFKKNWKKYIEIITDVADVAVHLGKNPTKFGFASVGMKIVNSYAKYSELKGVNPLKNPFTIGEGWTLYNTMSVTRNLITLLLQRYQSESLSSTEDGNRKYCVINIGDVQIGYFVDIDGFYSGLYVQKSKIKETIKIISECVWNSFDSNNLTISTSYDEMNDYEMLVLQEEEHQEILTSNASKKIYERVLSFLNYGYNRSIILLGPPGTGKSMALKDITKKLGFKSLRISSSDESIYSSVDLISTVVDVINPEILIIDDFDRIGKPDKLLSELEKLNNKLKLFFVSVNSTSGLDRAIIRPGRFDDIIDFYHLDDEIHDKLIGDIDPKIKSRLKKLPIAYIYDFHKRKNVFGEQVAISEIENLEKRINTFDSHYNDDEEESEEDFLEE